MVNQNKIFWSKVKHQAKNVFPIDVERTVEQILDMHFPSIVFRERELALQKQKATQAFIQDFKRAREQWKEMERQRMEEENRKIMEFAKVQQEREMDRLSKKKEKDASLAKVQEAVS